MKVIEVLQQESSIVFQKFKQEFSPTNNKHTTSYDEALRVEFVTKIQNTTSSELRLILQNCIEAITIKTPESNLSATECQCTVQLIQAQNAIFSIKIIQEILEFCIDNDFKITKGKLLKNILKNKFQTEYMLGLLFATCLCCEKLMYQICNLLITYRSIVLFLKVKLNLKTLLENGLLG